MGNCVCRSQGTSLQGTSSQENVLNDQAFHDIGPKEQWKQTVPFVAPVSGGIVIKVYDGDTITIASRLDGVKCGPLYRFSVRLNGIDTPEMKGGDGGESEKAVAILARDWLSSEILNKRVVLRDVKTEKYGRLLAEVWDKDGKINFNKRMIEKRFAVEYDGGTKSIPSGDWMKYYKGN